MNLTAQRLRELLHYDPSTGEFTWLERQADEGLCLRELRRWNARYAGTSAGTLKPDGYMRIKLDGFPHSSHRLAFLYMTGEWPKFEVDHLNGQRADNRWCNLRDATSHVNQQNVVRARRTSLTGVLGVSPVAGSTRFQARISIGGRRRYLGVFNTEAEAHAAYVDAKRIHHEGCTL